MPQQPAWEQPCRWVPGPAWFELLLGPQVVFCVQGAVVQLGVFFCVEALPSVLAPAPSLALAWAYGGFQY